MKVAWILKSDKESIENKILTPFYSNIFQSLKIISGKYFFEKPDCIIIKVNFTRYSQLPFVIWKKYLNLLYLRFLNMQS